MTFKQIERLKELASEYRWEKDYGLVVFIDYEDCEEVFSEICKVDFETYLDYWDCDDYIAVPNFEKFLECYTDENIEDIFPKED